MTANSTTRLTAVDLNMQFGGQVAVNNINCELTPERLTAVIGPNGAGKTTLFNLFSGQLHPTYGKILFNDEDVTRKSPAYRTRQGIGRAFQRTNLFPRLSVLENVCIAVQIRMKVSHKFWTLAADVKNVTALAHEYLDRVGLAHKHNTVAASLSHGGQRRLEIGLLMALEPKVYMFDEPTTGMSVEEIPAILTLIEQIRQDKEKIVVLVEHKMDVVSALAERVLVLNNGRLLADGDLSEVMNSPQVQRAYLGVSPDAGMKFG